MPGSRCASLFRADDDLAVGNAEHAFPGDPAAAAFGSEAFEPAAGSAGQSDDPSALGMDFVDAAQRPAIEAVLSQVPGMDGRTRGKALGYLARFFEDIATDASVQAKVLKSCVG